MPRFPSSFACVLLWLAIPALAHSETGSTGADSTIPLDDANVAAYRLQTGDEISRFAKLFATPTVRHPAGVSEASSPRRGWLGISMKDPEVERLDPMTGKPIQVIEVGAIASGSGADAAGLLRDDLIVGINGGGLQSGDGGVQAWFRRAIAEYRLGDIVKLQILRGEKTMDIPVTLHAYPKTKSRFELQPEIEVTANASGTSLLQDLLEREGLTEEFAKLLTAIRNEIDKAVSSDLRNTDYNPFRLHDVNHVMSQPMDLPAIARGLSNRLAGACNAHNHDLGELIRSSIEVLDPAHTNPKLRHTAVSTDVAGYLKRLVDAIAHANAERTAVLSVLDKNEIELLYVTAPRLLEDVNEDGTGERDKVAKRNYEDNLLRFFKLVMKLDLGRLMDASATIADAIDPDRIGKLNYNDFRLGDLPRDWVVHDADGASIVDTPAGRMIIGGTGDNTYDDDAMLIIDFGGNDKYFNHAGGSTEALPFTVVIDVAGSDIYSSSSSFSQGAGFLGGGFLVDVAGNDRYVGTAHAQGVGVLGVGMLADLQGSDQYSAIAESQGAGIFGAGILADGGGDDIYSGKFFVQGAGYIKGIGAIVESGGNDYYIAGGLYPDRREPGKAYLSDAQGFGYGMRPDNSFLGTSGGMGIIAEAEGNDTYVADYFAQGASYWYSLGILDDRKGNDRYIAGRYAQGAGIHASAGILLDGAGDDRYVSDYGVSQGCGHDYGIGMLLDGSGNDRYISGTLSQGAGNATGIGVLSDFGGNDQYIAKDSGQGWGNLEPTTATGSFGLLFDTGGRDSYSLGGKSNSAQFRTGWGIQLDSD